MLLETLIPVLQLATGPVILISGIGLILLSITNRFGRVIDRTRFLTRDLRDGPEAGKNRIYREIKILSSRAKLLRGSISFLAVSTLFAAVLIIAVFLGVLYDLDIASAILILFVLCMFALVVSILLFIIDINFSLKALWVEFPIEK